jgi:hypothetical protein
MYSVPSHEEKVAGSVGAKMLQVFFSVLALVAASVHLAFSPKRRSGAVTIVRTYLFYLLFIYVGLMGLFTAYYHVFRPIEDYRGVGSVDQFCDPDISNSALR